MTTRALRSDALIEHRIQDGHRAACGHLAPCGCHHWPGCCEACPYPDECRLVGISGGINRAIHLAPRNAAITTASHKGAPIDDICDRFHLSRRRVFHILQEARKGAS